MQSSFLYLLGIYVSVFLWHCSCSSADNKEKEEENNAFLSEELKKQINVQNFFNTLPSAAHIFQQIKECRLNYKADYLNDPTKYKNYSLEKSQALNLGIYGADLAIAVAFNQSQESMRFLKCTNHLAQELGISSAFDESTMERLERNKENRDSTLQIISKTFKVADTIFAANKRDELSVLMLVGAYVESMYVAGQYALSKIKDTTVFQKIQILYAQQLESLSYLIQLMQISTTSEEKNLLQKLQEIEPLLQKAHTSTDAFNNTHQLFAELRQQIISTY